MRKIGAKAENPWRTVLRELRNPSATVPRQSPGWKYWMRFNHEPINAEYDRRETTAARTGIALRTEIAMQLFDALPEAEKTEWEGKSKESWASECERFKSRLSGEPSTDPEEQEE